jgi:hypothetical protein
MFCGNAAPGKPATFPVSRRRTCRDLESGAVTVHLFGKSRRAVFLRILAFLGLATCVFSWGLQYKLSLYDPPQAPSHQIPSAKLLSRNEQSRATDSPREERTRTSAKVIYIAPTGVFLIGLPVFIFFYGEASGQRLKHVKGSWHRRRVLFSSPFVRPPPVLI